MSTGKKMGRPSMARPSFNMFGQDRGSMGMNANRVRSSVMEIDKENKETDILFKQLVARHFVDILAPKN